ncbi:IclR family transcriptional regulator [Corynebacterium sphenisci]|uniref:IclR family transcriptional regulator n=1 Tax=Corynebacterium sphenisci TaxID=191493 RepID=UPI0026DF5922|nr:IclR family transcriptional regulator [Corynebacterium sphenisci]MDO5731500.1 IclR family transcriptional regulator [Corynebacterium sphenisci]
MGQTSTAAGGPARGDARGDAPASGIKVLDRSVRILTTVAEGPCTLTELCERTGLPRATAHRLATALEVHRLVTRTADGRWTSGPGLADLTPVTSDLLTDAAAHVLPRLMELTGESVQIYRLTGDTRTCIASMEPPTGLRNTVPVGSRMPLTAGSAGRVMLAFGPEGLAERFLPEAEFGRADLEATREAGWAESIGERDPALASVSAPVRNAAGEMEAVLSVSGPVERLTPSPYAAWGREVLDSAELMGRRL